MNMIQKIALVFTIIGAINWGLIGLFNFNLVEAVFGEALLSAIIYMIVGIAGIINIMSVSYTHLTLPTNSLV